VSKPKFGVALAAKEHLASGEPITRLEALVLYGVSNLTDLISEMRKQGWVIQSRLVSYAAAMARINRHAVLQPPPNLPVREIQLTEYWVSK
jgi:Helix-turn-helix domain